ncbi:MAG: tRNA pseudouridine(38-40) synthase TruA [bacterium]
MRNIKLTLEYDGTDFSGWQWQPQARTVQGALEGSLEQVLRQRPKVIAAGRTDAGVHALGQVVNFKTERLLKTDALCLALNSVLPQDVRVLKAEEVDEQFHARFSAREREYRYVFSRRLRAVGRQYCWYSKFKLDLEPITQASQFLLGTHDFSAFSRVVAGESHYLCDVKLVHWQEGEDKIVFRIVANRFLHNMVRIIVGTLLEVGRGKLDPQDIKAILESRDRTRTGSKVPPQGLFLEKIYY